MARTCYQSPMYTPVLLPLMLSIEIPASSNVLWVQFRSSFCWGSIKSASVSMMPKNLWSNSFNLKRQMQTLQRSLRSWGFRLVVSFLPLYQSGSGCLRLSRFAAIRVVPGGGVKPLFWNVHNTVLSLRQNLPETVQPFTYIKILQSLWCIQRHPKKPRYYSYLRGNYTQSQQWRCHRWYPPFS